MLDTIKNYNYEEFYDEGPITTSLVNSLNQILKLIDNPVVASLVFIKIAIHSLTLLSQSSEILFKQTQYLFSIAISRQSKHLDITNLLYVIRNKILAIKSLDIKGLSNYQAWIDSVGVLEEAIEILESSNKKEHLLETLDHCFQGYAYSCNSLDRRILFNWWIDSVKLY